MVAVEGDIVYGAFLLLIYSLGMGLPLLAIAYTSSSLIASYLTFFVSPSSHLRSPLPSPAIPTTSSLAYHEICKALKISPPSIHSLIERLNDSGFRASRTHFSDTGVKTEAKMGEVKEILRNIGNF